jgi:hypothetical protein
MKTRVSLQRTPNSKFDGVARSIAKGDPPDWLVLGLQHFSGGIGVDVSKKDRRSFDTILKQMQGAVHTLTTWLPAWVNLGYGYQCPEHVALMLYALPLMKKDLDIHAKKRIGRRSNTQQEICAAVIMEAWKLLHGKAEPQSLKLQQACSDYWQACGGKQIGGWNEPENWRRPIERALAFDHSWINRILVAVQNER